MQRLSLVVLLLSGLASTVIAQEKPHNNGITFSFAQSDSAIELRHNFGSQWAALASIGYSRGTLTGGASTVPGPAFDMTSWTLGAALRRRFTSDELRPFIELGGALRHAEVPGCRHFNFPFVSLGGGVEYFIARRVSIEGSASAMYSSYSQDCSSGDTMFRVDQHAFSTLRSALSLTFYF